jgi:predicted Zn-dependent peptidase
VRVENPYLPFRHPAGAKDEGEVAAMNPATHQEPIEHVRERPRRDGEGQEPDPRGGTGSTEGTSRGNEVITITQHRSEAEGVAVEPPPEVGAGALRQKPAGTHPECCETRTRGNCAKHRCEFRLALPASLPLGLLLLVWLASPGQPVAPRGAAVDTLTVTPPDASADGARLPVVEHTLSNGMRFLVLQRETPPTVSFVVHVPVGSTHEALGHTGAAHMLEHLLFKGTTTVGTRNLEAEKALFARMDAVHDTLLTLRGMRGGRTPEAGREPGTEGSRDARIADLEARIQALEDSARTFVVPNEFDEILSRAGARGLNASTSWEATEYYVELPAHRARLWFALEADRMRNPVFREFYREREVVEEERRARLESDPGGRLWEEHMGAAFRVHPYGVAPIGHMSDIRNLTRAQVEEFHRRHYGPENTVVAIVGAIEPDSVVAWAEGYFGPMPRGGGTPVVLAEEPEQRGERRIEVLADAEPQLRVGWKVGDATDPDLAAFSMLANILVGGRDARLHRRLIRDERLATFVSAGLTPGGRDPGLFTIQSAPRSPHTSSEVEAVIEAEIARIIAEPPTPLELERVRVRLEASRVRRLISNQGLALQLAQSTATWGDWRTTFELQSRLQAVTAEDVVRAARRLVPETKTVGVLRRPEAP